MITAAIQSCLRRFRIRSSMYGDSHANVLIRGLRLPHSVQVRSKFDFSKILPGKKGKKKKEGDVKGYYELLAVSNDADQKEIKKSFQKLAMMYHPDQNRGSQQATELFMRINEAYNVIGNPKKRENYDNLSKSGLSKQISNMMSSSSDEEPDDDLMGGFAGSPELDSSKMTTWQRTYLSALSTIGLRVPTKVTKNVTDQGKMLNDKLNSTSKPSGTRVISLEYGRKLAGIPCERSKARYFSFPISEVMRRTGFVVSCSAVRGTRVKLMMFDPISGELKWSVDSEDDDKDLLTNDDDNKKKTKKNADNEEEEVEEDNYSKKETTKAEDNKAFRSHCELFFLPFETYRIGMDTSGMLDDFDYPLRQDPREDLQFQALFALAHFIQSSRKIIPAVSNGSQCLIGVYCDNFISDCEFDICVHPASENRELQQAVLESDSHLLRSRREVEERVYPEIEKVVNQLEESMKLYNNSMDDMRKAVKKQKRAYYGYMKSLESREEAKIAVVFQKTSEEAEEDAKIDKGYQDDALISKKFEKGSFAERLAGRINDGVTFFKKKTGDNK